MKDVFERFGRDRGPARLGEALKAVVKKTGLQRRLRWRDLDTVWREVVREEIASHTRVFRLANGRLEVEVDSAALMQELAGFYKSSILSELRSRASGRRIKNIVFRLGEFS